MKKYSTPPDRRRSDATINVKISRETALQRIADDTEKLDLPPTFDIGPSLFKLYRDFCDSRTPMDLTIDGVLTRYRFLKTEQETVIELPETEETNV